MMVEFKVSIDVVPVLIPVLQVLHVSMHLLVVYL